MTRIQAVMSGQRVTMSETKQIRTLTLVPGIGTGAVPNRRMQAPPDDGAKPPQQDLDNLQGDPNEDPDAKPPQQDLDESTPPPPPDEGS